MNIHYKIVELWPDDHLMVARYWTDVLTEEMLAGDANRNSDGTPVRCRTDVAINIPIPVPTGKELDVFIKRNAPLGWLKMMEDVKSKYGDFFMFFNNSDEGKLFWKNNPIKITTKQ